VKTTIKTSAVLAALLIGVAACGSSSSKGSAGATTTAAKAAGGSTTAAAGGGASGAKIGNCDVSGTKGSIKITPAVAGQLTVQTALPAPGWFNGDTPESIKDGYEYCMAANIAYRAGLDKVVVQNVNFDQLVAAGTKDFDLALAEISITDKRKQVVDFSVPYFASDIGVLVKKDTKVAGTDDLKKLKLGVQDATTGADFAKAKINPDAKSFPDAATMFAALDSGAVDAVMTDTSIVQEQEKKSGGAEKVVGQYKTGESYGALYPKNSKNGPEFDKAITDLINTKVLNKLASTYLSGDPASVPFFTA
jgi:polar amino acid transport system substrate-binding protein